MNVCVFVPWRDVRLLLPFVQGDGSRPAMNGVRVEFERGRGEKIPARMIAVDNRRLAVLQSQVEIVGDWPAELAPAFTVPYDLVKRFKKPPSNSPDHTRLQLEISREEKPLSPDAPEGTLAEIYHNVEVTAAGYFDPLEITQTLPLEGYPDWRVVIPQGPWEPARDVKVYGAMVADFGEALSQLGEGSALAFYRQQGSENDERGPLVIRSQSARFFGVLSPAPLEMDETMELPLWVGSS